MRDDYCMCTYGHWRDDPLEDIRGCTILRGLVDLVINVQAYRSQAWSALIKDMYLMTDKLEGDRIAWCI